MKPTIDLSESTVWESLLTPDELQNVEVIINKMQCEPKPTVSDFLMTIHRALEKNEICKVEVKSA